jgi:hypothetical protein
VEIVQSHAPAWDAQGAWSVMLQPTLEIGHEPRGPAYEFDQIAGVVRLEDGRIVVADGGSSEMRVFDSRGGVIAVAGGQGQGPGEFESIAALGRAAGDTVWVYDFALRRITFYVANGEFVGTASLGPEIPTLGAVGRLDDGSFVMAQLWAASRTAEERTTGLRRDPVVYARFGARGELLDTIGLYPGREINLTIEDGRMVMGRPLFGRTSSHAVDGEHIFIGDQTTFAIGRYAADGALQRIMRLPDIDLAISADELADHETRDLAAVPANQRPGRRAYLDQVEHPVTRPAYQDFLVDDDGNLWVSEYAGVHDVPPRWTVMDRQGAWLGVVEMPARFRPYHIGASWMLGVSTDELDVESVQLYELNKAQ